MALNTVFTTSPVGYVLKRYPRFSETFIVNEILAHEAAGLPVRIFSLLPPSDTHFQQNISSVRAPVKYLHDGLQTEATNFWQTVQNAAQKIPNFWKKFSIAEGEEVRATYQALQLALEIRAFGIERIHAHFASAATTVARLAAFFADVPYSFTAHAKDIYHVTTDRNDLKRKIEGATSIITVSHCNSEFLKQICPSANDRIHVIYNGLDLNEFPYEVPAARAPLIAAVGRLVPKKGFADLIEACFHLKNRGKNFRCSIIGGGELETTLASHIADRGLSEFVTLTGPLPRTEVIRSLQKAAVLVAPCMIAADGNRDGLPTVLLEAMALGTPCISTNVTGIPEIIKNNETGLLIPQREPEVLAHAIETLLAHPEIGARISRQARALIEEKFDIHRNTEAFRSIVFAREQRFPSLQRSNVN